MLYILKSGKIDWEGRVDRGHGEIYIADKERGDREHDGDSRLKGESESGGNKGDGEMRKTAEIEQHGEQESKETGEM